MDVIAYKLTVNSAKTEYILINPKNIFITTSSLDLNTSSPDDRLC